MVGLLKLSCFQLCFEYFLTKHSIQNTPGGTDGLIMSTYDEDLSDIISKLNQKYHGHVREVLQT